jgi:hypothetical protein
LGANWLPARSLLFSGDMNFQPGVWYDSRGVLHLLYHAAEDRGIVLYHVLSANGVDFDQPREVMSLAGDMRGMFSRRCCLRAAWPLWSGRPKMPAAED